MSRYHVTVLALIKKVFSFPGQPPSARACLISAHRNPTMGEVHMPQCSFEACRLQSKQLLCLELPPCLFSLFGQLLGILQNLNRYHLF